MPFISAAKENSRTGVALNGAKKSLLARYYPNIMIRDMISNKDFILVCWFYILIYATFLIGFKSALLNTVSFLDFWTATVTDWALYCLFGTYVVLVVSVSLLIWYLWDRRTGLRWDQVTIADTLVLLHHSNFLNEFSGKDVAGQPALRQLNPLQVRLGYWKLNNGRYWHGFGVTGPTAGKRTPALWLNCGWKPAV